MSLADKFVGKVQQTHYKQPLTKDAVGVFFGSYEQQVFEFDGCTLDEVNTSSQITVTDVGGTQYTFTPIESYTDSSHGSAFFAKEECKVTRTRRSPNLWKLTFTRTGGKLIQNNSLLEAGPTWMDRYNVVS